MILFLSFQFLCNKNRICIFDERNIIAIDVVEEMGIIMVSIIIFEKFETRKILAFIGETFFQNLLIDDIN